MHRTLQLGSYLYKDPETKECLIVCPSKYNYAYNSLSKCLDEFPYFKTRDKSTSHNFYTCRSTNHCSGDMPYYFNGTCYTGACCANINKLYIHTKNICSN